MEMDTDKYKWKNMHISSSILLLYVFSEVLLDKRIEAALQDTASNKYSSLANNSTITGLKKNAQKLHTHPINTQ